MEKFSVSGLEDGNIRPRAFASKNPAVTALQDLLFYQLTGIGFFAKNSLAFQNTDKDTDSEISRLLYLCNKGINFGISTMTDAVKEAYLLKNREEKLYKYLCKNAQIRPKKTPPAAMLVPAESLSQMVSQANVINAQKSINFLNLDIFAMQEIIRYSLCSSANYLELIKKYTSISQNIYALLYEVLDFMGDANTSLKKYADFAVKTGELHTMILELTLKSYEKEYGFTEKKIVSSDYKKGNAILVAGEDFAFLKKLLEETENKGINIYTYGALNYAHAFSEISKYKNLAGIYVGKYDDFASNIEDFPGVAVLTSGNLEELTDIYRGRVFSVEDISMLGVSKLNTDDLKQLIGAAYDAQGFEEDKKNYSVEVGFGIKELEQISTELYEAIKSKKISNILIFLGCHYFVAQKSYLKKLIKLLPDNIAFIIMDCLFLKIKKDEKDLPMILNLGQYLNFYTLIKLLSFLSKKLKVKINELPVNITIRLRDRNAVAALLMLLSLGIKNIRINSDLPNYLTDALLQAFSKPFGLCKVVDAKTDAKKFIPKKRA
ncbi:MAG: hypothetical protein K6A44_02955 [bacterium]|nr:hypothetical protein [bacterium]